VSGDPAVELKSSLLVAAMPAEEAIVFGDVWGVHGGYAQRCLELGCSRAYVVDSLETPEFAETLRGEPRLEFVRGDFSDPLVMKTAPQAEVGVAFDVLLHQAPLVSTIHLMLEQSRRALCIMQPMLVEQSVPGSLVYLPGNPAREKLQPWFQHLAGGGVDEIHAFDALEVNHGSWIWGITRGFLCALLEGEGFELTCERRGPELANPNWYLWGCVAERRRRNPRHWSVYPTRWVGETDAGGVSG